MSIVLIIDFIGIAVGIFAIITVLNLNKNLGGRISNALVFFNWGVIFQILAFSYTVVFSRLKLLSAPPLDIHHLFMFTGMIFFVLSAKKFASLALNRPSE